jgi:hypothetical protein
MERRKSFYICFNLELTFQEKRRGKEPSRFAAPLKDPEDAPVVSQRRGPCIRHYSSEVRREKKQQNVPP